MRVVVYAEGPAEMRGSYGESPAPGDPLNADDLGAAHILVRRLIEALAPARSTKLRFDEPMRTHRNREAVGSKLLHRRTLRGVLQPALAHLRPDLAVVLVDEDGDASRLVTLKQSVEGLPWPVIAIGVAVREFESWLITDAPAISKYIAQTIDQPQAPESMKPGEAKELLQRWLALRVEQVDRRRTRREMAEHVDLDVLTRNSRSFQRFRDELAAKVKLVPA